MKRALPFLILGGCGIFGGEDTTLTESQEYYVGRSVAANTLKDYPLYGAPDHPLQAYVTHVGFALAMESDRPTTFGGYHFIVVQSEEVNAFAAPGGFIFVTTGLLKAARSEDELAGVLAHEIAHVNLHHAEDVAQAAADKAAAQEGVDIAGAVASAAGADSDVVTAVSWAADNVGDIVVNGYSREKEEEADALGAQIMTRGGVRYDPRALAGFLSRMPHQSGGWKGSTHPDPKARVTALENSFMTMGPLPATDPDRTKAFEEATRELR